MKCEIVFGRKKRMENDKSKKDFKNGHKFQKAVLEMWK